jgi:hypothetical protein
MSAYFPSNNTARKPATNPITVVAIAAASTALAIASI